MSTHIGYCVFLGKPHYLYKQEQLFQFRKHNALERNLGTLQSNEAKTIEFAFSKLTEDITENQNMVVKKYFGVGEERNGKWIKKIFELAEEMLRCPYLFSNNQLPPQIAHGILCQNDNRHEDALFIFDAALLSYPEFYNLHYLKSFSFYQKGQYNDALQSLKTLFRANPEHEQGRKLLKKI